MNAIVKVPVPTKEDVDVAMVASLVRAIEQAPAQNKLPIFRMIVRIALGELAARRQQTGDDLWSVARDVGLIDLLGIDLIQAWMAVEFEGNGT